eukprot:1137404-Pelagomonas_calceolata.AAC.1
MASCGRRGDVEKRSRAQKVRHIFDGESRPGMTDITDRRRTLGSNSLFNFEEWNLQPESGNVAKDMMGKIQEVRTIDDMSATYCCLLWDQEFECARPSSAVKRCDVQQESVLELRLMSAWRTFLRSILLHLLSEL